MTVLADGTCVPGCVHCGPRCWPSAHSPGGAEQGTQPFRIGKTRRDHASGAWAQRLANRAARARRNAGL